MLAVNRQNALGVGADVDEELTPWEALSCGDKMKFFNVWFFMYVPSRAVTVVTVPLLVVTCAGVWRSASIGNLCNIIGCVLSLRQDSLTHSAQTTRLVFVGLGCVLPFCC